MLPYYLLLNFFALPLNFLSHFSIDDFCLKDAHVTLKSHVTDKFRHGQVKETHIFTITTSFYCCLKAKCCLNCPAEYWRNFFKLWVFFNIFGLVKEVPWVVQTLKRSTFPLIFPCVHRVFTLCLPCVYLRYLLRSIWAPFRKRVPCAHKVFIFRSTFNKCSLIVELHNFTFSLITNTYM